MRRKYAEGKIAASQRFVGIPCTADMGEEIEEHPDVCAHLFEAAEFPAFGNHARRTRARAAHSADAGGTGVETGAVRRFGYRFAIAGNNNTIGDINSNIRTVISGNESAGGHIAGASRNLILSTLIGTGNTGLAALPNKLGAGILIDQNASNNTTGGPTVNGESLGGVISGNDVSGVILDSSDDNQVSGNFIGLGRDVSTILGNAGDGVLVQDNASNNTIGYNNSISGNTANGVHLATGATNNLIIDEYVGTDPTGVTAKPNQADGVFVDSTASNSVGLASIQNA